MESLGYILQQLLHSELPWQCVKAESEEERNADTRNEAVADGLFKSIPYEFSQYFQHTHSRESELNYAYLRRLFQAVSQRNGWKYDDVFDWTILNFLD